MIVVRLKPGREKSLLRRHPWVFAGAIQHIDGSPKMGEPVQVVSAQGEFLAWGAYSPFSKIRVRVWSWDILFPLTPEFIEHKLKLAFTMREMLRLDELSNAWRCVYAESDGLPGLIVDRYGDVLVAQFLSGGAEYWRDSIIDSLVRISNTPVIFERSDADVRQLEGLPSRIGVAFGPQTSGQIAIIEHGLSYWVDALTGQKTGFYLDQRQNRKMIRSFSANRDVLDCFSYSGGFSLNALVGGARSVISVDSSPEAIKLNQQNFASNELVNSKMDWLEGDVFQVLRGYRDQGRSFDLIILDPPKFAPTIAQVERAARGYKDINLLAIKLLRPEGILVTFSCSGGVSFDLFQKIVAGAALDARVDTQILAHLHQDLDHPIGMNFPEGEYLKGLVIRRC